MSVHHLRCPCLGKLECRLCNGTGYYDYEVGPRGWMPFRCPTCGGARTRPADDGQTAPCFTCAGEGVIDPAAPPPVEGAGSFLRKVWRIFFGG